MNLKFWNVKSVKRILISLIAVYYVRIKLKIFKWSPIPWNIES